MASSITSTWREVSPSNRIPPQVRHEVLGSAHVTALNVASGAGLVGGPDHVYSASKFGVVGLSESLAGEPSVVEAGIGVTLVCPSFVRTQIAANSAETEIEGAIDPDPEQTRRTLEFFNRYGLPTETVGGQVLDAVREDQLYVITDRLIEQGLRRQADALRAALPEAAELDQETAVALYEFLSAEGRD